MKSLRFVFVVVITTLITGCATEATADRRNVPAREVTTTVERTSATPAPTATDLAPGGTRVEERQLPTATAAPSRTPTATAMTPTRTTAKPSPEPSATVASTPTVSPTATLIISVDASPNPEMVERGLEVYQELYCGICHRLEAAGTAGMFGPSHDDLGSVAKLRLQEATYNGEATTPAEYIRESIVNPGVYIVEGYQLTSQPMPAFTTLSEEQLDALVEMLVQQ